jgi:broad specificity phosphatase PhoE
MPQPILYFVRHGETDWNRERRLQGQHDIPLNALGRTQAVRCGVLMKELLAKTGVPACRHRTTTTCRARSAAPARPWN